MINEINIKNKEEFQELLEQFLDDADVSLEFRVKMAHHPLKVKKIISNFLDKTILQNLRINGNN